MTELLSKYPNTATNTWVLEFHKQVSSDFDKAKKYYRDVEISQANKGSSIWEEWVSDSVDLAETAKNSTSPNTTICLPFYNDYFVAVISQSAYALLECSSFQGTYISSITLQILQQLVSVAIFTINLYTQIYNCAGQKSNGQALNCMFTLVSNCSISIDSNP
jgi:hypothetical protein